MGAYIAYVCVCMCVRHFDRVLHVKCAFIFIQSVISTVERTFPAKRLGQIDGGTHAPRRYRVSHGHNKFYRWNWIDRHRSLPRWLAAVAAQNLYTSIVSESQTERCVDISTYICMCSIQGLVMQEEIALVDGNVYMGVDINKLYYYKLNYQHTR